MVAEAPSRDLKGARTILQTLLGRAEVEPDRLYGSFPLTNDVEDGFRDFTIGELAQAVDVCAWRIKEQYGLWIEYETILYMGPSDFRYTIFTYAAIKCGYKACFQNPGNPVQDNLAILEKTGCVKAFYSVELEETLMQYRRFRPQLLAFELPSLLHFFESKTQQFPYQPKPWNEAKHEPILVLHSSGTTGAPKPIIYRNGIVKYLDSTWPNDVGPMNLFDRLDGAFFYAPFPSFHSGAFLLLTVFPTLFTHCATVMAPAASSPRQNARLAIQIIKQKRVKMLIASPFLLEELARSAKGIETLAGLKFIAYGGAPLRQSLGDALCTRGLQPLCIYGTTETGFIPLKLPKREDWDWIQFPPELMVAWGVFDITDETYELCFRNEGLAVNELRGIHWSLQVDEWRSNDLFTRHPFKPGFWKFVGRKDDILVLGNGINVNPIPVEDALQSHELIFGAILAGENRWPPCALFEPFNDIHDKEDFKNEIRPTIDGANQLLRVDARIPYDYILVLDPGSFVRNPKGGVVRGKTVHKYMEQMDNLYAKQRR